MPWESGASSAVLISLPYHLLSLRRPLLVWDRVLSDPWGMWRFRTHSMSGTMHWARRSRTYTIAAMAWGSSGRFEVGLCLGVSVLWLLGVLWSAWLRRWMCWGFSLRACSLRLMVGWSWGSLFWTSHVYTIREYICKSNVGVSKYIPRCIHSSV